MSTELVKGERFGRWTVLSKSKTKKYAHHVSYNCRCDCGTTRIVSGSQLRRGASASCGCRFREEAAKSQRTHGLTNHRLAGVWRSMKERCTNPNHVAFHRYGGRGIRVCDRWKSLATFVADNDALAKPGLQLDRIDNNGPYSPENCRWATPKMQHRNKSVNVFLEHNGERMVVTDWAKRLGVTPAAIRARLSVGWSVADAVTVAPTPPEQRRTISRR